MHRSTKAPLHKGTASRGEVPAPTPPTMPGGGGCGASGVSGWSTRASSGARPSSSSARSTAAVRRANWAREHAGEGQPAVTGTGRSGLVLGGDLVGAVGVSGWSTRAASSGGAAELDLVRGRGRARAPRDRRRRRCGGRTCRRGSAARWRMHRSTNAPLHEHAGEHRCTNMPTRVSREVADAQKYKGTVAQRDRHHRRCRAVEGCGVSRWSTRASSSGAAELEHRAIDGGGERTPASSAVGVLSGGLVNLRRTGRR